VSVVAGVCPLRHAQIRPGADAVSCRSGQLRTLLNIHIPSGLVEDEQSLLPGLTLREAHPRQTPATGLTSCGRSLSASARADLTRRPTQSLAEVDNSGPC
jgi:hypothetical protein